MNAVSALRILFDLSGHASPGLWPLPPPARRQFPGAPEFADADWKST